MRPGEPRMVSEYIPRVGVVPDRFGLLEMLVCSGLGVGLLWDLVSIHRQCQGASASFERL